jgi:hypothetical protein
MVQPPRGEKTGSYATRKAAHAAGALPQSIPAHSSPAASHARVLRTLLVQGALQILGPFGADSDLRRWGLKLAEGGGRNGKKRAIIAPARKVAVLLQGWWGSGPSLLFLRRYDESDGLPRAKVCLLRKQNLNAESKQRL